MVGADVLGRHPQLEKKVTKSDFAAIVASACLAHDIGNPPFGHSGEAAIQAWFDTETANGSATVAGLGEREAADLRKFEGNAQGFRVLTKLQNANNPGGLQLTMATLAAFMKYPRESPLPSDPKLPNGQSTKKYGFFQWDVDFAEEVAEEVGLVRRHAAVRAWIRHPLTFLVEAADDICFRIVDFEDGCRLGLVPFAEGEEALCAIANDAETKERLKGIRVPREKIEYLRSRAIGRLVRDVVAVFLKHETEILNGQFDDELIRLIDLSKALEHIRDISKQRVYAAKAVVEIEAAGFEVLGGLLRFYVPAIHDVAEKGKQASPRSKKYFELLPISVQERITSKKSTCYRRLLAATDIVSGMTDSYAVSAFKKVAGISLPST